MLPEIYRKQSVAFLLSRCSHCKLASAINRNNMKLPINERIKIVFCDYYVKCGIPDDPIILDYAKHFTGFPTFFIKLDNGEVARISGINTWIELESILNTAFRNRYIIKEENFAYNVANCKPRKEGIFKNKIFCGDEDE